MVKTFLIFFIVFISFVAIAPRQVHASDWFSRFNFSRDRDDKKKDDDKREHEGKHKKHGRAPHHDDTIIAGTIYDSNHNPVNGDKDFEKVTVTCNGVTKIGDIGSNGRYSVSFKKSQCDEGDAVTTSAVTEEGSGSNSSTVYDDPDEGPCGDTDVTVLDVSVPEFGPIAGLFTAVASVGGYLKLRKTI